MVASAFPHHGEEDCLRGWRGSGTVFFAHCGLRCVFCQNYDISHGGAPAGPDAGLGAPELAAVMLRLQAQGCHNINLVTPAHVVPQVLEALAEAMAAGLDLPIVYNTSGYDAPAALALLDGIVDVYMPDFKLWSPERGQALLAAPDYPAAARAAIREMHRQVGDLVMDGTGLARRGVLVRHLILPGLLDETAAILRWLAGTLGVGTYVNLMDQYHPAGRVGGGRHAEMDRRLTREEFREALHLAAGAGLRRLDGFPMA